MKVLSKNNYARIVAFIIDNLEGGYYHPDMLNDGRVKDSRYGASGETMFGIDRLNGGTINTTEAGRKFWGIIDGAGARKTWKWNYKGGSYGPKLKALVAEMMYPQYEKLSERYLSEKSKKIIEKDNRLFFNYVYSTWNGSGWFKKFAEQFNEAVESGITNRNKLVDVAVEMRTDNANSLIRQGGAKIEKLMSEVPKAGSGKKAAIITAIIILTAAAVYIMYKKGIIKKIANGL